MSLAGVIKGLLDKTPNLFVGLCVCESEDRIIFFGPHCNREELLNIVYGKLKEMVNNKPCDVEFFNWQHQPKAKNDVIAWLMRCQVDREMAVLFADQIDGYVAHPEDELFIKGVEDA